MSGVCSSGTVQILMLSDLCLAALSCENLSSLAVMVSSVSSPASCTRWEGSHSLNCGAESVEVEDLAVGFCRVF